MDDFDAKRTFKEIIVEFHTKGVPQVLDRDAKVPEYSKIKKVIVFSGPRRAGKTSLLYLQMKRLEKQGSKATDFLYCNLEDDRIGGLKQGQLRLLLDAYDELYPQNRKPAVFLDEVQAVTGWESFARRLCDSGYKVFVTGSNSLMLGREIATQLRGRNIVIEVLPLSFSEFLLFRGVAIGDNWEYDKQKNAIRKLFDEYFQLSGFPEVVLEGDLGILDEYFKTMFYRDVVERYRIRNSGLVRFLMNYLSRNYSCEFSIYKFNNVAKSNGYVSSTSVVQKYAEILSNTYFCMYATPLQKSPAKEAAYGRKAYLIDHGLANYFNVDKDPGRLMENLVCIELARRGKNLHYHKAKGECDFVTDDECIQVTYSLTDDNKAREVGGLVEAAKRLKPKKRTILTYDQESEITSEGLKIRVVPLWKWLLHSPDQTA